MASVSLLVSSGSAKLLRPDGVRMVLKDETGLSIPVMRAPRVTEVSNMGNNWVDSPRPGREAVPRFSGVNSPEMTMEFYLGFPNLQTSVKGHLDLLIRIAKSKARVFMTYSSHESGFYRVIRFDYEIEHRNKYNEPSRVRVKATFRRISASSVATGPVSGGVQVISTPAAPAPAAAASGGHGTYTVKKGDTLWALSIRYYGSGVHWRRIADANGVTDPKKLQIGKVLRIP